MVKVSRFYLKDWVNNRHFYKNTHIWMVAMETAVLHDFFNYGTYKLFLISTNNICLRSIYMIRKVHVKVRLQGNVLHRNLIIFVSKEAKKTWFPQKSLSFHDETTFNFVFGHVSTTYIVIFGIKMFAGIFAMTLKYLLFKWV